MNRHIYLFVLRFFPREFRNAFGAELLTTAEALDRDPRRRGARQLIAAMIDAIVTAFALRSDLRAEARADATLFSSPSFPPNRPRPMQTLSRDIRYAWRGLIRERGFSAFVVATLALGIGANAAMFGIADRLLLRGPEHVVNAGRVGRAYLTVEPKGMQTFTGQWFGNVSYDLLRENARSFSAVAQYTLNEGVFGQGVDAQPAHVASASETLFPLLGVRPQVGRFFDSTENAPGSARKVVVIGYGVWKDRFGGTGDVVGKSAIINDEAYTIVGVAPRGFTGPELKPVDFWIPINLQGPRTHQQWRTTWNAQWFSIVARLADGVSMEQATREMTALHRAAYNGDDPAMRVARMSVAPLSANESGAVSVEARVLKWLTGVSLLVLIIACANVANLLLARGMRRDREIAIRAALGAGRRRLFALLLIESFLLASAGAAAGLGIAYALGAAARAWMFDSIEWSTSPVDGRVVMVSSVLAIVTALLIGLVPAFRASRSDLTTALKSGAREGRGRRSTLRTSLTVSQAALSVLLLVGAGLFVRSLWNIRNLHLGIDPGQTLVVEVNRPRIAIADSVQRVAEVTRRRNFYEPAAEALRTIPGIQHAAVAIGMSFGNRFTVQTRIPGNDSMPRLSTGGPSISAVSADYFNTIGTRLVRGRAFLPSDRAGSEPVAIVNETMARTAWPGRDALGSCVIVNDGLCHRIVGIAEDTRRNRLREDPSMHYYIPLGQERGFGGAVILVRADAQGQSHIPEVRSTLMNLDPGISYLRMQMLQDRIDPQVRPWKLGAIVFALSGVLALLVAAIGVYSVMSYLIADRRHEIGVRLALGAVAGDIMRLVMRGSFAIAIAGVALGELVAFTLGRFAEPLLFETSPREPIVFGSVAIMVVLVALCATVVPALRARRVNPMEALRTE